MLPPGGESSGLPSVELVVPLAPVRPLVVEEVETMLVLVLLMLLMVVVSRLVDAM